jgi:mannose-1-phosphate guanylyltransferase/mannose-6-phosphate isomerase
VHWGNNDIGCKAPPINSPDLSYLAIAQDHTAEIRPLAMVGHIAANGAAPVQNHCGFGGTLGGAGLGGLNRFGLEGLANTTHSLPQIWLVCADRDFFLNPATGLRDTMRQTQKRIAPMTQIAQINPVILCGGSGTRLWPLSRQSFPKQFARLMGDESLFQASVRRLSGPEYAAPVVITGEPFRFVVAEQLAAIQSGAKATLIEPSGRNTAPAIAAAALWLAQNDADALMLVAPSDHVILDAAAFRATVQAAVPQALAGDLVSFGIKPDRPETGYGYLQVAEGADALATTPQPLARFVEKPDAARAARMLADGSFLWNAGIFLFTARAILDAYRSHAPQILEAVGAAVVAAESDLGFIRLAAVPWAAVEDISIDYAIMERSTNLAVMPYHGNWSDLGGWEAVWQESDPDVAGNVVSDHAIAIDCANTLLRSESAALELVGIGLSDIVAVAMPDAVIIAHKADSQRVKEAVAALKARGAKQATQFPTDHRPWGYYESLVLADRFQVKRIVVKPGAALSLQSHHHRSEHWIVVQGTARVTIDDRVQLVTENQSVYIPLGALHRMENPGKLPMVLIEVQTGSYLGEDDIIRYEDVYARK